jgi:hypothetical protein
MCRPKRSFNGQRAFFGALVPRYKSTSTGGCPQYPLWGIFHPIYSYHMEYLNEDNRNQVHELRCSLSGFAMLQDRTSSPAAPTFAP